MDIVKIIGIGLIATFISVLIKQYKPEFALPITLITSVLIFLLITDKLASIINLITSLSNKSGINYQFLSILLKITGIAFLTEFAVGICRDANESAIASKIEFGGKIIMLSLSIPIISALLETILKILP